MILILHILIALSSVAYSGYACLSPTKDKLRASAALVVLTLASGTYLVLSTHAPLTQACLSGLTYLGIVSVLIGLAYAKLAKENS